MELGGVNVNVPQLAPSDDARIDAFIKSPDLESLRGNPLVFTVADNAAEQLAKEANGMGCLLICLSFHPVVPCILGCPCSLCGQDTTELAQKTTLRLHHNGVEFTHPYLRPTPCQPMKMELMYALRSWQELKPPEQSGCCKPKPRQDGCCAPGGGGCCGDIRNYVFLPNPNPQQQQQINLYILGIENHAKAQAALYAAVDAAPYN